MISHFNLGYKTKILADESTWLGEFLWFKWHGDKKKSGNLFLFMQI